MRYGLGTVAYGLSFLLENSPQDYKSQTSLHVVQTKIRKRNTEIWECRLCKRYEGSPGFI